MSHIGRNILQGYYNIAIRVDNAELLLQTGAEEAGEIAERPQRIVAATNALARSVDKMPSAIYKYHCSTARVRRGIFIALDNGVELAIEIAPAIVIILNCNTAIRHRLHSLVVLIVNLVGIKVYKGILAIGADAIEDIILDVAQGV